VFLFHFFLVLTAGSLRAIEIRNDFEGLDPLSGYLVDGWGIRDVSTCEGSPQTAPSGTHAVRVPETCQPGYPNGNPGPLWEGTLTTPEKVLYGEDPGKTTDPYCRGEVVEILNPRFGGYDISDNSGNASLTVFIPDEAGGQTMLFQAIEKVNCKVSNLVEYTFP